jgi:hypothetical protein
VPSGTISIAIGAAVVDIIGRLAPRTVITLCDPSDAATGVALGDDIPIELPEEPDAADEPLAAWLGAGLPFTACATSTAATIATAMQAATTAARREALIVFL